VQFYKVAGRQGTRQGRQDKAGRRGRFEPVCENDRPVDQGRFE